MHCDLHWGEALRNRQYVHSLLSQCFVSCGSTNYTALWVTGYLGDLSAALVVDELKRQAVDRCCCKRPSGLRNWSVCTPPTFTHRTASELITVHRPEHLLPSGGLFQESTILHILDTQRVCSVSLTTDSANLCSPLQEYHRIFLIWHCCVCMFVIVAYLVIFLLSVYPIMVLVFPPSVVTALCYHHFPSIFDSYSMFLLRNLFHARNHGVAKLL